MSRTEALPDYDELPLVEGGARSGWGLFGENDNVGLINLQTSSSIVDAARLIRNGKVFTLDLPVDFLGPAIERGGRGAPRHEVIRRGDIAFDDRLDGYFPQGSTQWDALGHVGYKPGVFYNGVTPDQIASGERNTIEHWARRGIVGRAVLLDVVRALEAQGRHVDPFSSYAITVEDLEAARELGGARIFPGDVLLVRTGHCEALADRDVSQRRGPYTELDTPGLDHSEEMARYLW